MTGHLLFNKVPRRAKRFERPLAPHRIGTKTMPVPYIDHEGKNIALLAF
jgi:hypothetical protein